MEKADSITQSCIFEGSRSAGKSYRQCLNWLEDYKSRIDKAIEIIRKGIVNKVTKGKAYINLIELLNVLEGDDKSE